MLNASARRPGTAPPPGAGVRPFVLDQRLAGDLAVGMVLCGLSIACLVWLPLFADGSHYFFVVATEWGPVLPNLRVTAILPQLPAAAAFVLGAELPLGRVLFSAGYTAVPAASLLACWWLLRRRQEGLLLFVLLSFLALQLNFSGVSELLSSLYLTWPLVLGMILIPGRGWVKAYAVAAGPLLLLLHPLAFMLCFGLALLAWLTGRRASGLQPTWQRIGLWLLASGAARLLWTAFGLNAYERGRLNPSSALNYLLTETLAQHLLLATILLAVLAAPWVLAARQGDVAGVERRGRLLTLVVGAALAGAIWVGMELVLGQGVVLKSAATFGTGVLAMAAVSWLMLRGRAAPPAGSLPALIQLLCGVAILVLLLAKSTAWWTATRSLQNLVASSEAACIRFGAGEPYGLQWPWMSVVDDWATPFTALATRPFVPSVDGTGPQPVALLLAGDRCELLRRTDEVRFTGWMSRPFEVVDGAFGPLRRP
jgi:hypothetical protein